MANRSTNGPSLILENVSILSQWSGVLKPIAIITIMTVGGTVVGGVAVPLVLGTMGFALAGVIAGS